MIKNKALNVKIIFKTYLKIDLKHFMFINFCSTNQNL